MKKLKWTPNQIIRLRKRHREMTIDDFGEHLIELGFELIGAGVSRDVYRHPACNFVVKVGWASANRTEQELAEILPKRFVAKVLARWRDVLIQRYITGNRCPFEKEDDVSLCCPPSCEILLDDYHPDNHVHVGKSNRPVIFDLGYV